jgi:MFS family permease
VSTSTQTPAPPHASLFVNRDFALLWSGQFISSIGDYLFSTTAVLWIATSLAKGQHWAPLAVGGELIATTLPVFLVGPVAGVFVDRWDKRGTMLRMDALRALLILAMAPFAIISVAQAATWQLLPLYASIALTATCSQFFNPSRLALIGDLVEPEQQPRASSLSFMTVSLGITIGAALAAPLYVALGPLWALIIDAATFLVSYMAIQLVRAPQAAQSLETGQAGDVLRELGTGLRFFMGNRVLRTMLIVTSMVLFGSSAINALGVFFVTANLHQAPGFLGVLSSATGFGVLAGSVAAAWIVPRLGSARSYWLGTLLTGILILLYSRQTTLVGAVVLLFIIGLPSAWLNVAIGPLILQSAPRELIGRVAAVFTPATSLAALLSTALIGYLTSTLLQGFQTTLAGISFGPFDTTYLAGGALIALSSAYARAGLRQSKEPERRVTAR